MELQFSQWLKLLITQCFQLDSILLNAGNNVFGIIKDKQEREEIYIIYAMNNFMS